ncbi:MAG: sigma-70 family RNA polymerase sigma factor, partial [Chitinophagaceae bacterium]
MGFIRNISYSALGDQALLEKYREGLNLELLGALYGRYMDLVYGICLNYLSDPERSQDAVMNIFEELVAKLHRYEVVHFKSWLFTLAKNHCLMLLRSRKNKTFVSLDPDLMQSGEELHL